jgi:hypothetical protein
MAHPLITLGVGGSITDFVLMGLRPATTVSGSHYLISIGIGFTPSVPHFVLGGLSPSVAPVTVGLFRRGISGMRRSGVRSVDIEA